MAAPTNSTTEYKARIVSDYILTQFRRLRNGPESTMERGSVKRPLMVSMQGPQGAGELFYVNAAQFLIV